MVNNVDGVYSVPRYSTRNGWFSDRPLSFGVKDKPAWLGDTKLCRTRHRCMGIQIARFLGHKPEVVPPSPLEDCEPSPSRSDGSGFSFFLRRFPFSNKIVPWQSHRLIWIYVSLKAQSTLSRIHLRWFFVFQFLFPESRAALGV